MRTREIHKLLILKSVAKSSFHIVSTEVMSGEVVYEVPDWLVNAMKDS